MKYLVLMDSILAESPTTEYSIPENMIGWASRAPYVGMSSYEGTINQAESFANENLIHWVFDFGTNVANGTIGSVCWAAAYPESPGTYMINSHLCGTNFTYLCRCPRAYTQMNWGDGYLWGYVATGNMLYKVDPATGQEIASFAIPKTPYNTSMWVVTGGCFYMVDTATSYLG